MFWALDYLLLALILVSALLVVRLPNLNGSVMALSAVGTLLSVLFVVLGAPDVAHSEAVVGAIALPVLYLIAIGKARTDVPRGGQLGEEQDGGADRGPEASSDRGPAADRGDDRAVGRGAGGRTA